MTAQGKSQKITPFLWFDNRAEEAINFYVSVFPDSKINLMQKWPEKSPFPSEATKPGTVQLGGFSLADYQLYAFDAGPMFRFNPSISFFAVFDKAEEIDSVWKKLIEGGEALMPLDSYPLSDRYGWVTDRFGLSWQIMLGDVRETGQRIAPLLMYSGPQRGYAREAMNLYTSVFSDSSFGPISEYGPEGPAPEGMIKHAQFRLAGQGFMAMDNGLENDIPFNEAISFFVACKDQEEVDYYWNTFTEEGSESACGWLKDKYGVSWQIVPEFLTTMLSQGTSEQQQNVMAAINRMKKLDVDALRKAYHQDEPKVNIP